MRWAYACVRPPPHGFSTTLASCPCCAVPPHSPQVTTCLRKATSRSLVILDEFGKGTLTSDGVGLLAAILEHFAVNMSPPPRVLACTHFTELLQPEVLPRHAAIGFYTMSVLLPDGSSLGGGQEEAPGGEGAGGGGGAAAALAAGLDLQALDKHVFLYKLVAGHVAPSFGVSPICAVMSCSVLLSPVLS